MWPYRCRDAKETVEWYGKYLGMNFVLAIAEDHVPSTHAPDPYMHVFLDAGQGNCWRSSSCRTRRRWARIRTPPSGCSTSRSRSTASTVCWAAQARLEAAGIEVVAPTDHTIFKVDLLLRPSGHRLRAGRRTPRRRR